MGRMTLKRELLADAIANGAVTVREAASKAGMHESRAGVALKDATVARAIEERRKKRGDKTRRLLSRSVDVMLEEVEQPNADPRFASDAAKTAAFVIEKVGEDERESASPQDHARYDELRRRYIRLGIRLALTRGVGPLGLVVSPWPDVVDMGKGRDYVESTST